MKLKRRDPVFNILKMADFQVSRFPSQEVVERDQYEINILCWYWIGFYTGWWMFECLMLMWRSEEIFPLNIIWSNQWSLYGLRCETCQRVFKSTSTLIRELLIHNMIFTVVSYCHNPSPSSILGVKCKKSPLNSIFISLLDCDNIEFNFSPYNFPFNSCQFFLL